MSMTAEQKTREILTGSPVGTPDFLHEGNQVIRWLTGGSAPDAWVTFHPEGEQIIVRCAGCRSIIGQLPADAYQVSEIAAAIAAIRQAGHELHKPKGWPQVKVLSEAER